MVEKPKKAAKKSTGLGAYSARGFEPKEINNEESTRRYVRLLTGSLKREVCFRTYVDPEGVDGIPHKPKGTLADCLAELRDCNAHRHGVFLTINQGGNNKASITKVRALFIDADVDKGEGQPLDEVEWHQLPTLIVRRAQNWQAFWVLDGDFPLDKFTAAQKRLAAHYKSDPTICDLSRVMRVPGFLHHKGKPTPVVLIDPLPDAEGRRSIYRAAGLIYSADEVLAGVADLSERL